MYEIIISEKALKQIEKLETAIQERIFNSLDKIRMRPESFVTKLVGVQGYWLVITELFSISIKEYLLYLLQRFRIGNAFTSEKLLEF
jgi:hypothetical protein